MRRTALFGIEDAGRWALVRRKPAIAAVKPTVRHVRSLRSSRARRSAHCCAVTASCLAADRTRSGGRCLSVARSVALLSDGLRHAAKVYAAGVSSRAHRRTVRLPETIGLLRDVRRREQSGALISLSGADPLNLLVALSVLAPDCPH